MAWCLECGKTFSDNDEICPECGALLEDNPEYAQEVCSEDCTNCVLDCATGHDDCDGNCDAGIWPCDDDGQPVKPVLLTTVTGTQIDYEMTVSLLRSFGIPTVRDYPNAGQLVKILIGFTGAGMDIYVPENMSVLARELMNAEPVTEN